MSGIAAIFNKDDRLVKTHEINTISEAITIYGTSYQNVNVMRNIAFAYTHYNSTTKSETPQPIINDKYTLLFDGRLDNRSELARTLGIRKQASTTLSDAELVLLCWEHWQKDSLNKFYGEFALIVWDNINKQLIAARDQIGRRTLHYYETSNRLVIASSPRGIYALADIPKTINTQLIADALCNIYNNNADQSYFHDIKQLPPAHLLSVSAHSSNLHQYYDIQEHIHNIHYSSDRDYVEAATEHFENAVQTCMQSTRKIGAFMSGGLDSAAVAVTSRKFLPTNVTRLNTYTSIPESGWDGLTESHSYGDETPYVEAISNQHPHIQTHFISAEGCNHYQQQDWQLECMQMPIRNTLNMTWMNAILARAKQDNIGVMLSGELGNATLSHAGKGIHAYLWRKKQISQLLHEFQINTQELNFRSTVRTFINLLSTTIAPEWLWQIKQQLSGHNSTFDWQRFSAINPDFAKQQRVPERIEQRRISKTKRANPLVRRDNFWPWLQQTQAVSDMGNILQGFRAMYNIELRDPFADRRLIEWSIGVPEDQFSRLGQKRWLIKRMMKSDLPDIVLHKPKDVGRQIPDWHLRLSRDLPRIRQELQHYASDQDISGMLDIPKLIRLLDDWPKKTITSKRDDRRILLPGVLPHALQLARFIEIMKNK